MKNTSENPVVNLPEAIQVQNDGELLIATGKSRFETSWKNKKRSWSVILRKLSKSLETPETHAEYMQMPKDEQDRIKDIGGFVGGHLKEGRRKNGFVAARQILTLDMDFPPADLMEAKGKTIGHAMAIYSTHKHSEKSPRYRLIIPLNRPVSPDEYEAIGRKVAEDIGIDYFDDSTFQPARLMYWPSHSTDVAPVFEYWDEPFMKADDVLATYPDWTDVSYWPMSSRALEIRRPKGPAADPLQKKGIVGAFCRTYTITQAIAKFLPEVYLPTGKEDRYTYAAGSTAAGFVVYNDDTLGWSNHSTDPAAGASLNAFDLVRIHLFGDQDDGHEDKTGASRPSFKAMQEFAQEDPAVRVTMADEAGQRASEDFGPVREEEDWRVRLRMTGRGTLIADSLNAELIMRYDEHLHGLRFNEMAGKIDPTGVPWKRPPGTWRDADDAQLYQWIAKNYNVQFPKEKFNLALTAVADDRRFHPVKEYLESLPDWDGQERVETLLIDYLGAEDTRYVREATRKALTAAVTRIYEPGAKFDTVLVLQGPQGIGKSMIFDRLAVRWFSDRLSIADMRDSKTGSEKLQGYWIIEISEMVGMRKVEAESVKSFISTNDDIYRAAYGRNTESHPRRCIIVGSTNEEMGFLRDTTGNRRFWPVRVPGGKDKHPWDITKEDVAQIWAEVMVGYELGESLLLSPEATEGAIEAQVGALETDERQGIVEEFLDRTVPENWERMDADARERWLDADNVGDHLRQTVSIAEIMVECFHRQPNGDLRESRAIGAMLQKLGWVQTGEQQRGAYGKQRIYRRRKR